MAQLILFLIYVAVIAAIIWQVVLMLRQPALRSTGRILFVAAATALIAGVVYFGVLH